ncbi:MAG: ABC transporter permease [Clostridia bacterium]|nr:ABC transporter permease [Clostridia bacterium]
MKKTLLKETLRSISANRLRFLSIIIIVALGISFFIGIKSSSPAMGYSANEYFRINNLLDIRVTSKIPFSDEDVEKIKNINKVDYVVRSKFVDAVVSVGDSTLVDVNGMELSCRISSLDVSEAKKFTQTEKADDSYVNRLVLKNGRYPEKAGECLVDATAVKTYESLDIGSVIRVPAEDSAVRNSLKMQEFTVVGTVDSPMYISTERGTTDVGSGALGFFVYVDENDFKTSETNELFVKITYDDIYDKFDSEYENVVDAIAEEIKTISSQSINSNLAEIKVEYNTKIFNKQREISDYEKSSAVEIEKKQKEINDFKKYVDSEDEILAKKKEQNDAEIKRLKADLDAKNTQLNTIQSTYDGNIKAFESQSSEIKGYSDLKNLYDDLNEKHTADKLKLDEKEGLMKSAKADLDAKKSARDEISKRKTSRTNEINKLNSEIADLKKSNTQLENDISRYESETIPNLENQIVTLKAQITELESKGELSFSESMSLRNLRDNLRNKEKELETAESKVTESKNKITSNNSSIKSKTDSANDLKTKIKNDEAELVAAESDLNSAQVLYDSAKKNYDDAKTAYDADTATLNQYKTSMDKLTSGQANLLKLAKTIEEQKKEVESLKVSVTQAQIRYSLKVRNGSREIQKEQYDLDIAKNRYYTIDNELTELKTSIEKKKTALETDLKKLQNTLNNIDSITWQTTTQPQLVGHSAFEKSMENILSMSDIFPIIFFVTAMIACFVIMMKNVEEGRGSIGLLKAFGYSNFTITGKYTLYSLLAWLSGAFVGGVLGTCVVPSLVYSIFDIVYTVPNVGARFDLKYILIGLGVSFVTTMVATLLAVVRELKMHPAALMRPRMIGYNRRSVLERLPDFWDRLHYGIVLLIRTVIRSRKRVAVGSIAIACCTALILSSLGLLNSVTDVSDSQYGKDGIFSYDVQFVLNAQQNPEESAALENIKGNEEVASAMLISNISMTASKDEKKAVSESVHVIVPSETDNLSSYINLEVIEGSVDISKGGVVLSEKLAQNMDIGTGDMIYFTDANEMMHPVKVIGIVKNYIEHYAYMSDETFEGTFFSAPQYKYIICTVKDYLTSDEISAFTTEFLKTEDIAAASTAEMMSRMADTAINQVMLLVIIFILSACLLAMIVMYTTSNVNISERTHEIANIKVIGFSDGEVLLYVIRENIISTAIGMLIGLVSGIFLHSVLVNLISVENVMYGSSISWWSFFAAAGIIIAVALLAALPVLFKINKVKMAETLKSIE